MKKNVISMALWGVLVLFTAVNVWAQDPDSTSLNQTKNKSKGINFSQNFTSTNSDAILLAQKSRNCRLKNPTCPNNPNCPNYPNCPNCPKNYPNCPKNGMGLKNQIKYQNGMGPNGNGSNGTGRQNGGGKGSKGPGKGASGGKGGWR